MLFIIQNTTPPPHYHQTLNYEHARPQTLNQITHQPNPNHQLSSATQKQHYPNKHNKIPKHSTILHNFAHIMSYHQPHAQNTTYIWQYYSFVLGIPSSSSPNRLSKLESLSSISYAESSKNWSTPGFFRLRPPVLSLSSRFRLPLPSAMALPFDDIFVIYDLLERVRVRETRACDWVWLYRVTHLGKWI